MNISMKLVYQYIAIFFNFLWWMKMTIVNSGLKGLMLATRRRRLAKIKTTLGRVYYRLCNALIYLDSILSRRAGNISVR